MSTYHVESAIYQHLLAKQWDPMTEDQRITFLRATNWSLSEHRIVGLVAVSGAALLGALALVVDLAGFEFYTGMSTGLYALAELLGVTLPFAAYLGASSAVALATGPIALIIVAMLASFGVYEWLKGEENINNRLRFVVHLHNLKVAAIRESDHSLHA